MGDQMSGRIVVAWGTTILERSVVVEQFLLRDPWLGWMLQTQPSLSTEHWQHRV